jgi:YHS domain-containing protein/TusA-related sulfurtransferase
MHKHLKTAAIIAAAAFLLVLTGLALQTTGDTAKDPVCGMTVKTAGAKYMYDYKGATYYFCSQGCKDSFAKEPDKYLKPSEAAKPMGMMMGGMHGQMQGQQMSPDMAKDPVCGMTVKKADAKYTYEYKGTTYYFCGQGCKDSFAKEPEKYLAPGATAKPMGMMMGGMHGQQAQMKPGEQAGCNMGNCPMMLADVEKKVQNTKDGVVITMTSKNPETVKKIQDHAAKMTEAKKQPGGQGEANCPMGANCPMKKK